MDNALQFVLGYDTTNPHPDAPLSRDSLNSIWADGMQGIAFRVLTGRLSFLFPMSNFKRSCTQVHNFVEFHIQQALNKTTEKNKSQVAVETVLAQTDDRTLVRNMLVQGIIGAQDTTSVLTSNTIHLLARHPALWKELRGEVLKHGDEMFTFDTLRSNDVIQNMLSECKSHFRFDMMISEAKPSTTSPSHIPRYRPRRHSRHHAPNWGRQGWHLTHLSESRNPCTTSFLRTSSRSICIWPQRRRIRSTSLETYQAVAMGVHGVWWRASQLHGQRKEPCRVGISAREAGS